MAAPVWSETAGDRPGSLVAVVHGSMDRSAGLLRLSRRLDGEHRVLRYDRRGYGRSSDVGPPWNAEANIDDLEQLLVGSSAAPATVFGHSYGGNVALGLAARRPDLVHAVIVYETPLSWLAWWPRDSAGAAAMAQEDAGDAAEAFMRRLVGDAVWEGLPATKRADRRREGRAMVGELADLRRAAPWTTSRIGVPVLALYGEHARPHHRRAMRQLGDTIADGRSAMIEAAGHAGPHTHADAVAVAVESFLASVSERPSPATNAD